jgi:hypothetical protein
MLILRIDFEVDLGMLILREENPGEKPSKQWKESTTNSTHI